MAFDPQVAVFLDHVMDPDQVIVIFLNAEIRDLPGDDLEMEDESTNIHDNGFGKLLSPGEYLESCVG